MILTVTLNAAIDRTVAVPSFRQGHRHRAVEASTVAGGKGVNVARALKLLDRPVIATGLAGGPTGARLMERLAEESILTDFTWIAGESRTNLAVVDPDLRRADRDQRARPRGQRRGARAVPREAALPGARRPNLRDRRQPAAVRPGLVLGPDRRGAQGARRRDDRRHRGRAPARLPARRPGGGHPERARGRGRRRPRVQRP